MNSIFAFVAMIGCMFLARKTYTKQLVALEPDKKVLLIDLFAKKNTSTYMAYAVIVIGFLGVFLNNTYHWVSTMVMWMCYAVFIIGFLGMNTWNSYNKLVANHFSKAFINAYLYSTLIKIGALIVFFVLMNLDHL